jgi:hypothetical protein
MIHDREENSEECERNNMLDNATAIEIKRKDIQRRMKKNKYPNTFYHYTSVAAFYNIIKSHQIWFGNAAAMNDKNEGKEFANALEEALLCDLPDENRKYCTDFFDKLYARIENEATYLMSLSGLKDDVGQWERYADNARGIRIGFNLENFWLAFYGMEIIINKVFYSGDIRQHEHYKILSRYFTTNRLSGFSNEIGIMDNLIACGYIRKHESFKNEEEIRVATLWNGKLDKSNVECELVNGQIKNYMKMDMEFMCDKVKIQFEDLFSEILIGPKSKQQIADLKLFLHEQGMDRLAQSVKMSDCPLR